jgi:predicted nucleotidyltransferase component of viral defense system
MKISIGSLLNKLKKIAIEEGKTHMLILTRYFNERLLFRISTSKFKDNFCLKGGTLIYAWELEKSRPTTDIDLLASKIKNDAETCKNIFKEICQQTYQDDFIQFDATNITTEEIIKNANYNGIRVKIKASFTEGNINQTISVDIGFGDIVTPAAIEMEYPTIIDNFESPKIKAYSMESVIAEKFQAMLVSGTTNSRMKDFYDIFKLLQNSEIDTNVLEEAILNTLRNRETPKIPTLSLFSDTYLRDNPSIETQWKSFLKKHKLDSSLLLPPIFAAIVKRLEPIYQKYLSIS